MVAQHDLEGMILRKQFSRDLYYRPNVFPMCVPPLRERAEDIPQLVKHFMLSAAKRMNKTVGWVSSETMSALVRYPWPGDIRKLENVIERAVILSRGSGLEVLLRDLNSRMASYQDEDHGLTLEEVERNHILATLRQARWVLSGPHGKR